MESQPSDQPTQPKSTNGLAITSLVISIVGCGFLSIIAIILGHVSRSQLKRNPNQQGAGLALAGLIIGYLGLVAAIGTVAISAASAIAFPVVSQVQDQAYVTMTKSNMRMIHVALVSYENVNGRQAQSLEELVPDFLEELPTYIDPVTKEQLPYAYFTDQASIPYVLGSPRASRGKRVVVYQDGRTEEVPEIEYQDRLGGAP